MSTGLLVGLAALTATVLMLLAGIAWRMWPKARAEASPQQVAAPKPERAPDPYREATLDPADRATLPPTVGLFEDDEDLADAETVMASSEDMARVLADLRDE